MSEKEEKGLLEFNIPRIIIGVIMMILAFFLYGEYLSFFINAEFAMPFRLSVFFLGQIISITLLVWSGVLLSKKIICPECQEGLLIFPLADLYKWLPSLPFSPKALFHFTWQKRDSLILNSEDKELEGKCQCCGAQFTFIRDNLVQHSDYKKTFSN